MKKQAIIVMDRSRKSLDREQDALRKVQEALELKESAAAEVSRAVKRENYMLDLMTDASEDMAGISSCGFPLISILFASLTSL
jgi:hypothetical protein